MTTFLHQFLIKLDKFIGPANILDEFANCFVTITFNKKPPRMFGYILKVKSIFLSVFKIEKNFWTSIFCFMNGRVERHDSQCCTHNNHQVTPSIFILLLFRFLCLLFFSLFPFLFFLLLFLLFYFLLFFHFFVSFKSCWVICLEFISNFVKVVFHSLCEIYKGFSTILF